MARGRPKKAQPAASGSGQGAVTGYESELWAMADALRGSMDASEYKHVVLGLIFLKYISDAFEGTREVRLARHPARDDPQVGPRTDEVRPPLTVALEGSEQVQHASEGPLPVDSGHVVVVEHRDARGRVDPQR